MTIEEIWNITGIALIVLIFIVLSSILDFLPSALKERRVVKEIEAGLPEESQGLISDLTFKLSARKSSQIDHILVTTHGIYVIEQKNYVGKLYGEVEDSHWRKWSWARTLRLQNPFKQNQGHIKAIQSALNARSLECINVVVIIGNCSFEGVRPHWLCMGMDDFINKIKERRELYLFKQESIDCVLSALKKTREPPSLYTDLKHIHNINQKYKKVMKLNHMVTFTLLNFMHNLRKNRFTKNKR